MNGTGVCRGQVGGLNRPQSRTALSGTLSRSSSYVYTLTAECLRLLSTSTCTRLCSYLYMELTSQGFQIILVIYLRIRTY